MKQLVTLEEIKDLIQLGKTEDANLLLKLKELEILKSRIDKGVSVISVVPNDNTLLIRIRAIVTPLEIFGGKISGLLNEDKHSTLLEIVGIGKNVTGHEIGDMIQLQSGSQLVALKNIPGYSDKSIETHKKNLEDLTKGKNEVQRAAVMKTIPDRVLEDYLLIDPSAILYEYKDEAKQNKIKTFEEKVAKIKSTIEIIK